MVNSSCYNNLLCGGRDCSYCRTLARATRMRGPRRSPPAGLFEGSGTIMKKVAIVTVAVLALGLAACNKNNADNNAANETAVENNADVDVNAATNDSVNAADNALNATDNAVANAGNAIDNAGAAATNATTNQ